MNQPEQSASQPIDPTTTVTPNRAHELLSNTQLTSMQLQQLMGAAPTFHDSIRNALFAIFAADSDQMSLAFRPPAPIPGFIRTLTQVAAQLLRQPRVDFPEPAIESGVVTRQVLARMNLTLDQALARVQGVNLEKQLVQEATAYWQASSAGDMR